MAAPGREPLRVVPWWRVLAWCAVAATPVVGAVLRDVDDVSIPVVASSLLLGAGATLGLDDPAEVTVAPVPTARWRRRATRLAASVAALVATGVALVLTVAVAGASVGPDAGHLSALAAATMATSLAIAARIGTDGGHRPLGAAASAGALLGVLTVAALAQRVSWLPVPGSTEDTTRWWLLAAAAAAVAVPVFDDPARPPYRPRSGPGATSPSTPDAALAVTPKGEVP